MDYWVFFTETMYSTCLLSQISLHFCQELLKRLFVKTNLLQNVNRFGIGFSDYTNRESFHISRPKTKSLD